MRIGWMVRAYIATGVLVVACVAADPTPSSLAVPSEGGAPTDANVAGDAGDAGDAGRGPSFCSASRHDFCADFDEDLNASAGFSGTQQLGACSVGLVGDFTSAPRGLELHCTDAGTALLNITLVANGRTGVHFEADVKYTEYAFSTGDQAHSLFQIDGNADSQVVLIHGAAQGWFVALSHGSPGGQMTTIPNFDQNGINKSAGKWVHVIEDAVLSKTDGSADLVWDGNRLGGVVNVRTSLDDMPSTLGVDLNLDTSFADTSPEVTLRVDNVTVDLR